MPVNPPALRSRRAIGHFVVRHRPAATWTTGRNRPTRGHCPGAQGTSKPLVDSGDVGPAVTGLIGRHRDRGFDPAPTQPVAVAAPGIGLVGEYSVRSSAGAAAGSRDCDPVEDRRELRAVAGLARGEQHAHHPAAVFAGQMEFCCPSASAAAECVVAGFALTGSARWFDLVARATGTIAPAASAKHCSAFKISAQAPARCHRRNVHRPPTRIRSGLGCRAMGNRPGSATGSRR